MDEKVLKWLYDIRDAINEIESYFKAYDNISDEDIWAILSKHLPILKSEVADLIDKTK